MEISLTELKEGEEGAITSVNVRRGSGRGQRKRPEGWGLERRLTDMGLTPGTKVIVVKSAPFHGPLELLIRGSRLAIGRGMAARILVEVER